MNAAEIRKQRSRFQGKETSASVVALCIIPEQLCARWTDADQRADRLKHQHVAFFKFFALDARKIPNDLLDNHDSHQRTARFEASNSWQRWERQYANEGELQLAAVRKHLPDVLEVRPISDHGNVNEIIGQFGGPEQLRTAINQLKSLLDAV